MLSSGTKRFFSVLTAFVIVLSIFSSLYLNSSAAPSLPAVNTEARHGANCTSLSADAQAYYTGQYTYANLSALSGSSNVSSSASAAQNNALYSALKTLMTNTQTFNTSYSGTSAGSLAYYWQRTDAVNGNAGYFTLFYSDGVVSVNGGGNAFNREHVWPKSNASFYESNGGSDLHHLRPADPTVNSTRSNLPFGNVRNVYSNYTTGSCYWKTSTLFEPKDDVKGDVARILLYVYVRWGETNLYTDIGSYGKIIESLDTLLEWIKRDPVDTWEMKRNDLVEDVQGNRNVFIDYPELAYKMFGRSVPADLISPSRNCTHSWTVTSTVSATCTVAGTTTYRCTICGETKAETVPALGHNYNDGVVTVQPTTTTFGTLTYTCQRCGNTYTEQIDKLPEVQTDRYDLDGNGEVAVSDVSLLLDYIAGAAELGEGKSSDLDGDGETGVSDVSRLLDHIADPTETPADIVLSAYALSQGSSMSEEKTLTGRIVAIGERYSASYQNITLTIAVPGLEAKPIVCYRMKGAENVDISGLSLGDVITVTGTLTNYRGTIEFAAGCLCGAIVSESDVGHALSNISFEDRYSAGDTADAPSEDDEYTTVSFTYRFEGDAPVTLRNDMVTFGTVTEATPLTITVTATDGTETYSATFETTVYPAGYVQSMEEIVNEAYELASGETLEDKTLTGVVTAINDPYTEEYQNISVTIVVGKLTNKPILCYHVTGEDGVDLSSIFINDTVTVTGTLTSYYGTIEFKNTSKITSIEKYQYSDAEKVEYEKEQLSINPVSGTSLPIGGATFSDVTITWALPAGESNVRIVRGVLTIDNTGLTQSKDVTLTATLSCGQVAVNKTFIVAVSAESSAQTEEMTWTLTFPGGNNAFVNNYTTDWTATMSGINWSFTHFNNGQESGGWTSIRAGHKSNSDARTATIIFTIPGTVETVKLNIEQIDALLTDGIVLNVKSKAGAIVSSIAIDSLTAGEHTFVVPASVRAPGLTYEFVFSTQLGSSNGFDRVSGVTAEGYVTVGGDPQPCSHVWSDPVYTWAGDNSTCAASSTCTLCGETAAETVNTTSAVNGNTTVYTASFTVTPFTTQTKSVTASGGQTAATWELTFPNYNDNGVGSYTASWTATVDGQVWTISNFNNNNNAWSYIKCSNKNNSGTATISTTISGTVSSVVLAASKTAYATAITLTIKNGSATVGTVAGSLDPGTQTFTIPAAYQGQGYTYEIAFDFNNTTNTNGTIWVESVTVNGYAAA